MDPKNKSWDDGEKRGLRDIFSFRIRSMGGNNPFFQHPIIFLKNIILTCPFIPHINLVLSDLGQGSAHYSVRETVGLSIWLWDVGLCRGFYIERRPLWTQTRGRPKFQRIVSCNARSPLHYL